MAESRSWDTVFHLFSASVKLEIFLKMSWKCWCGQISLSHGAVIPVWTSQSLGHPDPWVTPGDHSLLSATGALVFTCTRPPPPSQQMYAHAIVQRSAGYFQFCESERERVRDTSSVSLPHYPAQHQWIFWGSLSSKGNPAFLPQTRL